MPEPLEVLLIEDNPADADLTREALARGKLHLNLHHVLDGEEALGYLRREGPFADVPRPDLLLLDLNLPRRSGREVLAEVKADPEFRAIPVVVLTSSNAEQDIAQSYALGANCYVTKPVGLKEFESIVLAIESFWFSVVRLNPRGP